MKILFICENYLPHYGGAEVLFKNLAERYVQQGHTVAIITHQLQGTPRQEVINGVQVYRVPSLFSRYVFTFSAIPYALAVAKKYDLIQTTTFNGAFPAWLVGKLRKKPVVLTVHEVWVGKWKEVTGLSWWKSTLHDLLERCIYFLPFDRYVCVSESTTKDLLRRKIPPARVETIYNGFDHDFWNSFSFTSDDRNNLRKKIDGEEQVIYFSWGRPGVSKGFEYLIQAFPLVQQHVPQARLLLMFGSVEKYQQKYQELRGLITTLSLEKNITILSSEQDQGLARYIHAADGVVIPSLSEGFGYNVLEAVAMNKPLVISNSGSLPEIVSGSFQIFKSKDITDLAQKMVDIHNGKVKTLPRKIFPWSETIDKYLNVYRSLLE